MVIKVTKSPLCVPDTIVSTARTWIGTGFAHQGRRKRSGRGKGGVDCLGLLVGVAAECRLMCGNVALSSFDERDYGHFPDESRLVERLGRYMNRIESGIQAGDVLLLCVDGQARHLGIVGDYPVEGFSLIHAYAPARGVVEHRLDEEWMKKIAGVFRFQTS